MNTCCPRFSLSSCQDLVFIVTDVVPGPDPFDLLITNIHEDCTRRSSPHIRSYMRKNLIGSSSQAYSVNDSRRVCSLMLFLDVRTQNRCGGLRVLKSREIGSHLDLLTGIRAGDRSLAPTP